VLATKPTAQTLPSLEEVRRILPAECYQRRWIPGLRILFVDLALYAGFAVLTAKTRGILPGLGLSIVLGILVSALFVTGHDAAHDALLPNDKFNRIVALVCMLPSLHVRDGWVFGHNRVHHGFTVRRGMDFVWQPSDEAAFAAMSSSAQRLHRIEWGPLGAGVYYLRNVWWTKMIRFTPPERSAPGVPRDRRILAVLFTLTSTLMLFLGWRQDPTLIGALWMWKRVVLIPFLVFSWIIGATVHIHHVQPDLQWYEGKEWTRSKAQLIGTTLMRMPWAVDVFLHHIFIHVPHHVDARIPCYELNRATAAIDQAFPGVVTSRPFRFRDYVRATRECKLFDFEIGEWKQYPEHATATH
jgi:acyl-lipid omega-6 desaturase (Delta-12 desaturase)